MFQRSFEVDKQKKLQHKVIKNQSKHIKKFNIFQTNSQATISEHKTCCNRRNDTKIIA